MDTIRRKRPQRWFLSQWRAYKGLTGEQLAERLGTNKGQVSKLETGRQRFNEYWVYAFAEALGIEPADLFRDPNAPTVDDLLRNANPTIKKRAVAIIEALLKAG